jgi:hypothetical protein
VRTIDEAMTVVRLNTKIRLIIRRGFGFHDAKAVTALAMLSLGGVCPPPSPDGHDITHGNGRSAHFSLCQAVCFTLPSRSTRTYSPIYV